MCTRLVNLCLDVIADKFEGFSLVFHTTEDASMKLKFEFLHRKYSQELLERISAKDSLSEQFADLLINKYLKFLNTSWFRNCTWEKVTSKFSEIGCNIEKIIFEDSYFEEFFEETRWEDIISHLPNLKNFIFRYHCSDLILKNVAKFCSNLEEVDVVNSPVTFKSVKYLCKNEPLSTKLKKLCIAGTLISNKEDVKYLLKNLPSLEIIDYYDLPYVLYSLHRDDLSLDKVETYNITTLKLSWVHLFPYVDRLKVCLSVCPHLKFLTVDLVEKENLKSFPNLCDLQQLHIIGLCDPGPNVMEVSYACPDEVPEININNILKSNGGKLRSLSIIKCTVSVSILAKSCPFVEELILSRVPFVYDDDPKLVFNSLSSLSFVNYKVSTIARAIRLFLSSEKLESLSFKNCRLFSADVKTLIFNYCEMHTIKKISFYCCEIEKEYIEYILLNYPSLSYLNIEGCFGRDDEIKLLELAEILPNKPEMVFSSPDGFYAFESIQMNLFE